MKNPKEYIRVLGAKLESLGINDFKYSDSETEFGKSSYLLADGLKVRCSDHDISNIDRMRSEIPLFSSNFEEVVQKIERFYFPDRYKKITTLVFGDAHYFAKDKLHTIQDEFKVIEDVAFVTKKGREMSKIVRRNVEEVSYIRI